MGYFTPRSVFLKEIYGFRIMNLAISAGNKIKMKLSKKGDKYLDPAREPRKVWKMKVAVIPIGIGTLGTVPKGLVGG